MATVSGTGLQSWWTKQQVVAKQGLQCRARSLEIVQVLPWNVLSRCTTIVAPSNKRPKMKNGSSSGLSLPERPPWFMLLPEAMLVTVVCAIARGLAGVRDLTAARRKPQ